MNQIAKRSLAVVTAAAVAAGALFGGWKLYQNRGSTLVKVYDSNELLNTYWEDDNKTEGVVSTDRFQAVYLSDTQTVSDIQVKEGQSVKKGDILFTYDSTLTEIDLKRKQIEVQQKQLNLTEARKELNKIKTYRPGKPIPGSSRSYYVNEGGTGGTEAVPTYPGLTLLSGDGTQEQPFRYLWQDTFSLGTDLIAAAMQGKVDCYVCFCLEGQDVPTPEPAPAPTPQPEPTPAPAPANESAESKDDGSGDKTGDRKGESSDSSKDQKEKKDDSADGSKSDASGNTGTGAGSDSGSGNGQQGEGGQASGGSDDGSNNAGAEGGQSEVDPGPGSGDQGSSGTNGSAPGLGTQDAPESGKSSGEASDAALLSASERGLTAEDFYLLTSPADGTGDLSVPAQDGQEETVPYSAQWVYHCQHAISGYRYVLVSMSVGGMERQVMLPMAPLTDAENPEKQKKPKRRKVKDPGIVYSREELASMRLEQETEVRDTQLELRQLEVELKKLDEELNNSAVYSSLDGVVLELNDPKSMEGSQPVVKVSGGGGYLIRGSVSELSLDSLQLGQTVSISDWTSGESYEGTVQSISDYPASNTGWSDGNSNVSYYGFTVSVDASANLEQNNYVEMSYAQGNAEGESSAYLLNSFIRSEGPKSYILYEDDGRLVKQYVRTGRNIWGMYTEIIGGIKPDVYLAFPYGKKVREGAPTQRASVDELYGG